MRNTRFFLPTTLLYKSIDGKCCMMTLKIFPYVTLVLHYLGRSISKYQV